MELDQVFIADETSAMLGGALWKALEDILPFEQNKLFGRIQYKLTHDYIATLSNLLLGKEIAAALAFPSASATGAIFVGGTFAKNFVMTSVARFLPHGTSYLRTIKTKQRQALMSRIIKNTGADLSYERG
jgi:hypothetical protein